MSFLYFVIDLELVTLLEGLLFIIHEVKNASEGPKVCRSITLVEFEKLWRKKAEWGNCYDVVPTKLDFLLLIRFDGVGNSSGLILEEPLSFKVVIFSLKLSDIITAF